MKTAVLSLLVSAAVQAAAQADASTADCCRILADKVKPIYPRRSASKHDDYKDLVTARWSMTSMQHPGCIVTPTSAHEMSDIVKKLAEKNCRFAVKSGGHNPNPGFNNIDGGVSIDLKRLNSTSLSADRSYVSLGTGLSWGQAYDAFEAVSIAFTGGICGDVGVGGLAVGGGQSLFQAGLGWVVDQVIDYELVLASGEIVHANQQNHPDLYKALKGGSTNFGIVTKIDLAAFEFPGMWGGQLLVALDGPQANRDEMQQTITDATVDFVADNHRDVDSGIQIVSTYLRNGSKLIDVALSNTADVADAPALRRFLELPNRMLNTARHASLAKLARETSLAIPRGFRYVTASITITNDKATLLDFWRASDAVYDGLAVKDKIDWLVSVVPQPALQQTFAAARGGNVLGLQDEKQDQLVLWLVSRWNDASLDSVMEAARKAFIDAAESVAKKHGTFSPFIYLNYAGPEQDPLCGYGAANVAFMKGVAKKYDPTGVFQRLQPGGFKLDHARCA